MKTKYQALSFGALLVVGIGTITLFQNCSSGSVPVDATSTSAVAAAVSTPLLMYPAATSVTAGGSVILTVTGGVSPYSFAATGGSVATDPLAGYIFTAPATAGSSVITVTDSAGVTYTAALSVVAAVTATVPAASTSVPIYRYYNSTTGMHSFSASPTFTGGSLEGTAYRLAASGASGGVPLYQCAYNPQGPLPSTFYYDTTQANCEGYQATATLLGYIYPNSSVANTQPLYRFRYESTSKYGDARGFAVDHIDSPNAALPAPGWISESVLGYVPTN